MGFFDWPPGFSENKGKTTKINREDIFPPYEPQTVYGLREDIDRLQVLIPDGHCAQVMYNRNDTFEVTRYEYRSDGEWYELNRTSDVPIVDGNLPLGISGTLHDIKKHRNRSHKSVDFEYNPPPAFNPVFIC